MLELITEPLEFAFIQKALLGIILASINCAVIGTYVILRRMSFMGEALTHTLLPGIVFAYLKGMHLFFGALMASVLTALGIGFLSSHKEIRQDTAIGVMLSFMFALGVLMMSSVRSFRDFSSILFGSILGVTVGDLILMGAITTLVLFILRLLHKEMELSSVDSVYSTFIGIKPNLLRHILLLLIALSVVSAVQMIGALLTTALIITPAAAASLLGRTLPKIMGLSVIIAIVSGITGLLASYHLQIASGAAIVICCSIFFIIAWCVKGIGQWKRKSVA